MIKTKKKLRTSCFIEFFEIVQLSSAIKNHTSVIKRINSTPIHWLIAYYHITSACDLAFFTS